MIGFLLAAIAINYRPPDLNPGSTWFVPILLLGIPIFDTSLVVISRLRRRKPLFQADRYHTYPRLVNLEFTSPQAVIAIHAAAFFSFIIGASSHVSSSKYRYITVSYSAFGRESVDSFL